MLNCCGPCFSLVLALFWPCSLLCFSCLCWLCSLCRLACLCPGRMAGGAYPWAAVWRVSCWSAGVLECRTHFSIVAEINWHTCPSNYAEPDREDDRKRAGREESRQKEACHCRRCHWRHSPHPPDRCHEAPPVEQRCKQSLSLARESTPASLQSDNAVWAASYLLPPAYSSNAGRNSNWYSITQHMCLPNNL